MPLNPKRSHMMVCRGYVPGLHSEKLTVHDISSQGMNHAISRILKRLEKQSRLEKTHKLDIPSDERMLAITRETGELISAILLISNARNVLEIGTSVGYSTLWCADTVREKFWQHHYGRKKSGQDCPCRKKLQECRNSGKCPNYQWDCTGRFEEIWQATFVQGFFLTLY